MSSMTYYFIIVIILSVLFLILNFLFAPHNPYQEKDSVFECGFHGFFQNRKEFFIMFFSYAILFLLFDLDLFLCFPLSVSIYDNELFGITIAILFFILITIGFVYELGTSALTINSRQYIQNNNNKFIIEIFNENEKN